MTLLSSIHQVLIGHVGEHSHPLHPGFVHFPLAFYSLAYTLDILSLSKQVIPRYLPFPGFIGAAWYLHAAGVITAVPAAITGIAEYFVIRKQSPAKSWSILHGGLNVAITTISLFQLFSRSRNIYLAPTRFQVSLSAIGAILGMLSGYVGGLLVYKHATGVQRQGAGITAKRTERHPNEGMIGTYAPSPIGKSIDTEIVGNGVANQGIGAKEE